MSLAVPGTGRVLWIGFSIVVGLLVDVRVGLVGQLMLGIVIWAVLFRLLAPLTPVERRPLFACLVFATLGEIVLSLGWGLYAYRLGNIPLFVPPGHVLLLLAGIALAPRLPERAAEGILILAGAYTVVAAAFGFDTLGVLLFAVLVATAWAMPRHRRLYASTFVLALGLELLGTSLGNWTWHAIVPGLPLTTSNPPLAAGAFYAALDALVAVSGFASGQARHRHGTTDLYPPAPDRCAPQNIINEIK